MKEEGVQGQQPRGSGPDLWQWSQSPLPGVRTSAVSWWKAMAGLSQKYYP